MLCQLCGEGRGRRRGDIGRFAQVLAAAITAERGDLHHGGGEHHQRAHHASTRLFVRELQGSVSERSQQVDAVHVVYASAGGGASHCCLERAIDATLSRLRPQGVSAEIMRGILQKPRTSKRGIEAIVDCGGEDLSIEGQRVLEEDAAISGQEGQERDCHRQSDSRRTDQKQGSLRDRKGQARQRCVQAQATKTTDRGGAICETTAFLEEDRENSASEPTQIQAQTSKSTAQQLFKLIVRSGATEPVHLGTNIAFYCIASIEYSVDTL
mmetsp:Transcript_14288/g.22323  ORF Transcript_14288/g.22323 Transcript_14288/m.22323 type:complete len:268 (-) Transcript_14288:1489-2292(-)